LGGAAWLGEDAPMRDVARPCKCSSRLEMSLAMALSASNDDSEVEPSVHATEVDARATGESVDTE
jgi:hypothetical protein